MKGLYKSTGYWQTQAAKEDWTAIAEFASENGLKEIADVLIPPGNWGWRRIDGSIGKLREALGEIGAQFVLPSAAPSKRSE